MKKIEILVTNDDGIASPGLAALVKKLQTHDEYHLSIIAPLEAQSAQGCSHAHGDRWVRWTHADQYYPNAFAVLGSPATCISIALRALHLRPDFVVSGINFGENLGLNSFYSGTLGAAWEAALSVIPALAASLELPPNLHYTLDRSVNFAIAAYFTDQVLSTLGTKHPASRLWNLNIPTHATETTPIRTVALAKQRWNYPVVREHREHHDGGEVRFEFDPTEEPFEQGSDIALLREGFVTLTSMEHIDFPWRNTSLM